MSVVIMWLYIGGFIFLTWLVIYSIGCLFSYTYRRGFKHGEEKVNAEIVDMGCGAWVYGETKHAGGDTTLFRYMRWNKEITDKRYPTIFPKKCLPH